MKTILSLAVLSTLGLTAGVVSAAEYGDVATVISATPIVERVATPRRECYTEQVTGYDERRVRAPVQEVVTDSRPNTGAGAVVGAIIGGVIGHQFGNSSAGRDHGTAAGAVIGGLIGNSAENENARDSGYRRAEYTQVERIPVTRDVQRCNVVSETREVVRGYDVRYTYNNREYATRLSYDPGPTIPVNVEVRPSYRAPVPSYNRY